MFFFDDTSKVLIQVLSINIRHRRCHSELALFVVRKILVFAPLLLLPENFIHHITKLQPWIACACGYQVRKVYHNRCVMHFKRRNTVPDANRVFDHLLWLKRLILRVLKKHLVHNCWIFFQQSLSRPVPPDVSILSLYVLAKIWKSREIIVDIQRVHVQNKVMLVKLFILRVVNYKLMVAWWKVLRKHKNGIAGLLLKFRWGVDT